MELLTKADIRLGSALWLPEDADELDEEAFGRSGLHPGALDHPVAVVDTMRPDHDYIRVCVMTGTFRPWRGDIPVYFEPEGNCSFVVPECSECKTDHRSTKDRVAAYHEEDGASMPKHTHIGTSRVYEVSLSMVRRERNERHPNQYKLDDTSLHNVLDAVQKPLKKLDEESWVLRKWPAPAPLRFDMPSPEDFDPNAGYTTGYLPGESPSEKLASRVKPDKRSEASDGEDEDDTRTEPVRQVKLGDCKATADTRNDPTATQEEVTTSKQVFPSTSALVQSIRALGAPAGAVVVPGASETIDGVAAAAQIPSVNHGQAVSEKAMKHGQQGIAQKPLALKKAAKQPSTDLLPSVRASAPEKPVEPHAGKVLLVTEAKSKPQTTPPADTAPAPLPTKPLYEYRPGYIVWLLPGDYEYNIDPTEHIHDPTNRPCVVVETSPQHAPDEISICTITSLAGQYLDRLPATEAKKRNYLAIASIARPNPLPHRPNQCVHTFGDRKMPMDKGRRDDRISYINANTTFRVKFTLLQPMRESAYLGAHRLDAEGLEKLRTTVAAVRSGMARL